MEVTNKYNSKFLYEEFKWLHYTIATIFAKGGGECNLADQVAANTAALDKMKWTKVDVDLNVHGEAQQLFTVGNLIIGYYFDNAGAFRLSMKSIGEAALSAALTRPKLIGGERTHYTL